MIRLLFAVCLALGLFGQDRHVYVYSGDLSLLRDPDVVRDLKLTAEQMVDLANFQRDMDAAIAKQTDVLSDEPDPKVAAKVLATIESQFKVRFRKLVTDVQWRRFGQLVLQITGYAALAKTEVQDILQCTPDQVNQIRDLLPNLITTVDPEARDGAALARRMRDRALDKLAAVLTYEQRQKFHQLQGVPMKRRA